MRHLQDWGPIYAFLFGVVILGYEIYYQATQGIW